MTTNVRFPSAKIYAQDMLLFVVSATYSCIAPLTLLAGLCYFAVHTAFFDSNISSVCMYVCMLVQGASLVYTHQLLYIYVPICETGGKWWPKMARCFVVSHLFILICIHVKCIHTFSDRANVNS